MLSSNGHNHCSVFRHKAHKYLLERWEEYPRVWYSMFLEFSFRILVKIRNSQFPSDLFIVEFQQHSSNSVKHISWTIDRMKVHEYPLGREWSPMHIFYSSLGLNPIPTAPMPYFLTAARSQVRLTSVSGLSFPDLVGWPERHHLLFFFRIVWLYFFYHHWKVGHKIVSVDIKSSSIGWCRSTALVRVLILSRWPHASCGDRCNTPCL
jgi:hypothetical protein